MRVRFAAVFALILATGCVAQSGVMVSGAGPDDLLKLRKGPGLNHEIIVGLPDGTRLTRHHCQMSGGKRWCKVSVTDRPALTGYVSADYLAVL